jgi:hypothetical protein
MPEKTINEHPDSQEERRLTKLRALEEHDVDPAERDNRRGSVPAGPSGEPHRGKPGFLKGAEANWRERNGAFVGCDSAAGDGSAAMCLSNNEHGVCPVAPSAGHKRPTETIYFVNGITTTAEQQYGAMHQIADRCDANVVGIHSSTRGGLQDCVDALRSKEHDPDNRAAETVRGLVEENIKEGRDIHLAGHSRGALTISHALNDVRTDLLRPDPKTGQLRSKAEVDEMMSHVKVETFGGAAYTYPDGPQYVHYANTADFVPNATGVNFPLHHPGRDAQVVHFHEKHEAHSLELYLQHREPFPQRNASHTLPNPGGDVPVEHGGGGAERPGSVQEHWHGPYQHQLNKGGLDQIVQEQRLRATEARQSAGGASAVRAHSGSLDEHESTDVHLRDKTVIEFYTKEKPEVHPTNGQATWRMPEGEHLDIHVSKVQQVKDNQIHTTDYGPPHGLEHALTPQPPAEEKRRTGIKM